MRSVPPQEEMELIARPRASNLSFLNRCQHWHGHESTVESQDTDYSAGGHDIDLRGRLSDTQPSLFYKASISIVAKYRTCHLANRRAFSPTCGTLSQAREISQRIR
ncbi:hypothetical protein SH449x_002283 [Pirellulaceae bacterium SH449]